MFMQNSYTLYTVYYHIVNVHCIVTLKKKKLETNVTLFTMSKYFQRQFINGGKKVAIL